MNKLTRSTVFLLWAVIISFPLSGFAAAGVTRRPPIDFDGDDVSDIAVYRALPIQHSRIRFSGGGESIGGTYGRPRFVEDFSGNGSGHANWHRDFIGFPVFVISYNLNQSFSAFGRWGLDGDTPTVGDFDGNGKTDFAVIRDNVWWLLSDTGVPLGTVEWGIDGDVPVVADYDGDLIDDIAVFRPSTGTWWILRSSDRGYEAIAFGLPDDKPVPGDYDGDGAEDPAVYRASSGTWYLLQSSSGFRAVHFGLETDQPVPGDYDGDGSIDIAVFRSDDATWHILKSAEGYGVVTWGERGDIPYTNAYAAR